MKSEIPKRFLIASVKYKLNLVNFMKFFKADEEEKWDDDDFEEEEWEEEEEE